MTAGVIMRGTDETSGSLFSYVDLEDRIPARHPLRKIRQVVNDALASLDDEFDRLYVDFGRPSIPPERLIRASLIQILFSIRSERQLIEQMQYNLLFRWFVGLGIDDAVWVPTVFSKNRDRLLTTEMSRKVMAAILAHREVAPLLSDDHFSVDGTLIKAWASMKSFKPKAEGTPPDDEGPGGPPAHGDTPDNQTAETNPEIAPMPRTTHRSRNAEVDFKGEKRSNGLCRECGGNCRAAGSGHVTMAPVRPRGQGTLAREAGTEFPSHRPFASGSDRKPAAPRAASARFRRRAARSGS